MARTAVLVLVGIALMAVSAVGSYFFYQHKLLEFSFANMFLERTLSEARADFVLMNNIAEGKTDQAYTIVEGEVLAQILTAHYFPDRGEEADRQLRELISRLNQHYSRHPQKRQDMQARYPEIHALLAGGEAQAQ